MRATAAVFEKLFTPLSVAARPITSGAAGGASEAGVSATPVQNVTQAGILASASSPTDLAISGSGFFVTAQSATNTTDQFYTQAGDFSPDGNGNLVNSSGYYLLGYPVSTVAGVQTTSSTLTPVNVSALSGQAQATTSIAPVSLKCRKPLTMSRSSS